VLIVLVVRSGGNIQTLGPLLQGWRKRRRLSQLELASVAGVSTRHLSFLETGRSRPSRELVLHLAEHLDVPLRERNRLLLAAGFAPTYPETPINAPEMDSVREAIDLLMRLHDPFPALVMNQRFHLVAANRAFAVLTEGVAPHLLEPPINVMRTALHPDGLAARVVNLTQVRAHLLGRIQRGYLRTGDDELSALHDEVAAYPLPEYAAVADPGPPTSVVLPVRLRHDHGVLAFFSIIGTFDTPMDITVAELSIESFFPADRATEEVLRSKAREWGDQPSVAG
jgi:transcriptional regulator with XRE-family HTH domain